MNYVILCYLVLNVLFNPSLSHKVDDTENRKPININLPKRLTLLNEEQIFEKISESQIKIPLFNDKLPRDIFVYEILTYLSFKQILLCLNVCKYWNIEGEQILIDKIKDMMTNQINIFVNYYCDQLLDGKELSDILLLLDEDKYWDIELFSVELSSARFLIENFLSQKQDQLNFSLIY